jgi:hypothetical protein
LPKLKEDVMKPYALFVAATLLVSAAPPAPGQQSANDPGAFPYFSTPETYRTTDMGKVGKSYLECLKSMNNGVVESAIAHLTKGALCSRETFPQYVRSTLDYLAVAGRTPSIRYRAYLACLVLDSPELFAGEGKCDFRNGDELFSALSDRLHQTLLGYNGRKYAGPR